MGRPWGHKMSDTTERLMLALILEHFFLLPFFETGMKTDLSQYTIEFSKFADTLNATL